MCVNLELLVTSRSGGGGWWSVGVGRWAICLGWFLVLVGLVLDEVNLGLAWFGWLRLWDLDWGRFLGFLDQHVHQGLVFVLWLGWDLLLDWCRRCRSLDEDDLVVLLGNRGFQDGASDDLCWLLWWNVHVDVLGDQLLYRWRAILSSRRAVGLRGWSIFGRWWTVLLLRWAVLLFRQLKLLSRQNNATAGRLWESRGAHSAY